MEIRHVCSLGLLCHSSQLLKDMGFKKRSYPFDWIFSTMENILHCLADDFKTFLDQSYYRPLGGNRVACSHSFYHEQMFNHHDPLTNAEHYQYFIRCVDRFRALLHTEEHKLFVLMYVNMKDIPESTVHEIIRFNTTLLRFTRHYTLLVVLHLSDKSENNHAFTQHDNIDFLELYTTSSSSGVRFRNEEDNNYLYDIIKKRYNFNID